MFKRKELNEEFNSIILEVVQIFAAFKRKMDNNDDGNLQEILDALSKNLYLLVDFNNENEKQMPELVAIGRKIANLYGEFAENYNKIANPNSYSTREEAYYSDKAGKAFDAAAQCMISYIQTQID